MQVVEQRAAGPILGSLAQPLPLEAAMRDAKLHTYMTEETGRLIAEIRHDEGSEPAALQRELQSMGVDAAGGGDELLDGLGPELEQLLALGAASDAQPTPWVDAQGQGSSSEFVRHAEVLLARQLRPLEDKAAVTW